MPSRELFDDRSDGISNKEISEELVDYKEKLQKLSELLKNNALEELESIGKKDLLKECNLRINRDITERYYDALGFAGEVKGNKIEVLKEIWDNDDERPGFNGAVNDKSISEEDARAIFSKYFDIARFQSMDFIAKAQAKLSKLVKVREMVREEIKEGKEKRRQQMLMKDTHKILVEKGIL